MPNLENTLIYAAGGAIIGTGLYLYTNHYLDDFLLGAAKDGGTTPCLKKGLCVEGFIWSDAECKCVDTPVPNPTTPVPGASGTYTYWAKKKQQCRDNHLTFNYLIGYGVKILNWKL